MTTWSKLKNSLIAHLIQKGLEPTIVPEFVRCLALSLKIAPLPDVARIKQRMHCMGWTECEIDDDTLALAMACFIAQGLQNLEEKPVRWFEKKFRAADCSMAPMA